MTAAARYPACVLTGADGENPQDCATHGHDGDPGAPTVAGEAIALLRELIVDRADAGQGVMVPLDELIDLAVGRAGAGQAARLVTWARRQAPGSLRDVDKPRALVGVNEILHHQVTVPLDDLLDAARAEYGDDEAGAATLTEWLEEYEPGGQLSALLEPHLRNPHDGAGLQITGVTEIPPGLQAAYVYDLACGDEWDHPFGGFQPGHHVECSQHGLTTIARRQ